MRIPVILVVPSHDHLRRSAEAALEDTTAGLDPAKAPRYPGVEIDAAFAAVPLGDAQPGGTAIERMAPHGSARFAIRGHIEVKHPREVPASAGEAAIFSDPQVSPIQHLAADPILESLEQRERHDERRHAEREAEDRDLRDERDVGTAAGRGQVAQRHERLEAHQSVGWRGRSSGNRITSRIECRFVRSIASRSIPTPSPAVGGRPYSSAST